MGHGSGGVFESVTDRETYKAVSLLARMEGISMEPAAGVAFAGLIKLCNRGVIKEKDIVVVNCTGHTTPMEKINRLTALERKKMTSSLVLSNHEDAISVLDLVDFSETPRILIAMENEKTSRILQLYARLLGATEITSTTDQSTTLNAVQLNTPDLLFLDLASPRRERFRGIG